MTRPWHIDQRAAKAAREYLNLAPDAVTPEMTKLRDIIARHYDDVTASSVKEAMLRLGFMPHDDAQAVGIIKGIVKDNERLQDIVDRLNLGKDI